MEGEIHNGVKLLEEVGETISVLGRKDNDTHFNIEDKIAVVMGSREGGVVRENEYQPHCGKY